ISTTLAAIPTSLAGYQEPLTLARENGRVAAQLQNEKDIEQARALAPPGTSSDRLVADATEAPAPQRSELRAPSDAARESASDLADFLGSQLLPAAGENEACGREDYGLHSRDFLGAEVDFDETYEWGLEELARIDAEQREVAAR